MNTNVKILKKSNSILKVIYHDQQESKISLTYKNECTSKKKKKKNAIHHVHRLKEKLYDHFNKLTKKHFTKSNMHSWFKKNKVMLTKTNSES